ncbi:hypothetical protein DK842_21485 [Chromobacterium phragmitis]|nr:hypothetical protein DK842_21485 [Chromobacterium phragmitis]
MCQACICINQRDRYSYFIHFGIVVQVDLVAILNICGTDLSFYRIKCILILHGFYYRFSCFGYVKGVFRITIFQYCIFWISKLNLFLSYRI